MDVIKVSIAHKTTNALQPSKIVFILLLNLKIPISVYIYEQDKCHALLS